MTFERAIEPGDRVRWFPNVDEPGPRQPDGCRSGFVFAIIDPYRNIEDEIPPGVIDWARSRVVTYSSEPRAFLVVHSDDEFAYECLPLVRVIRLLA